jgi:threonine/homoserine/homoserine lactone efflux protein
MGLIAKILGGIIIFVGIIDMSHLLLAALRSTTYTFAYMLGYNTIEFLIAGGFIYLGWWIGFKKEEEKVGEGK